MSSPNSYKLTLDKRRGFVKIALETGSPLVPVFGFGETNTYGNHADGNPKLQKLMKVMQKKMGFALPLIKGRGWFNYNFGPLPHRRQVVTVVGMPLNVPKIEKPTKADLDLWHGKYVERLMDLYHSNKHVYDVTNKSEPRIVN